MSKQLSREERIEERIAVMAGTAKGLSTDPIKFDGPRFQQWLAQNRGSFVIPRNDNQADVANVMDVLEAIRNTVERGDPSALPNEAACRAFEKNAVRIARELIPALRRKAAENRIDAEDRQLRFDEEQRIADALGK